MLLLPILLRFSHRICSPRSFLELTLITEWVEALFTYQVIPRDFPIRQPYPPPHRPLSKPVTHHSGILASIPEDHWANVERLRGQWQEAVRREREEQEERMRKEKVEREERARREKQERERQAEDFLRGVQEEAEQREREERERKEREEAERRVSARLFDFNLLASDEFGANFSARKMDGTD